MPPPRFRAPALLLLLAVLAFSGTRCARANNLPPTGQSMAPHTKLTTFKQASGAFLEDLAKQTPATAFNNYLRAVRKPVVAYNAARWVTLKANIDRIRTLNKATKIKHVFGLNKLTDLTSAQRARYQGLKPRRTSGRSLLELDLAAQLDISSQVTVQELDAAAERAFALASNSSRKLLQAVEDIPDWSSVLPEVKEQSECGACWAFSAIAVAEAGSYIKTGNPISLSEKNLVDCDSGNDGCNGGSHEPAFKFLINKGAASAALYPYLAFKSQCPAKVPVSSRLASYSALPSKNAKQMLEALKQGPIAVEVTIDSTWYDYVGGVFTSSACSGSANHAVVVVGAGYDEELQAAYWLIRNSWGTSWGEGGYMRIARGVNMCNVESSPFQVVSADQPADGGSGSNGSGDKPVDPPPNPGCTDQVVTVDSNTNVIDLARQYKTTTAAIQLDNDLDGQTPLADGQELRITCPSGTWSDVWGVWNGKNEFNGLVEYPVQAQCPDSTFAVSFNVKPSMWYTPDWHNGTWVGTIKMTCSDGSEHTIDAQPDFESGWADGTVSQSNGFPSIDLNTGWAIDSFVGVGAQSGGEATFRCPANTVVTGIAGGTSPGIIRDRLGDNGYDHAGWIANLQIQCRDPFALQSPGKLRSILRSTFPKLKSGLSCKVHIASATDTWISLVSRYGHTVNDFIRANPSVKGRITVGTRIFIPPCTQGILQGTKMTKSAVRVALKLEGTPRQARAAALAVAV